LFRIAVVLAATALLVIIWLLAGDHISRAADYFLTSKPTLKSLSYLEIGQGTFTLGDRKWPLPFSAVLDSQARATVESFTLGPVQKRWAESMVFIPEPADQVSFIRSDGLLPWPTLFYGLFTLGNSAPKWSRHIYDRLVWKKENGAVMEIVWRDQQRLYKNGWTEESNNQLTGFHVDLGPNQSVAAAYVARTKHWTPAEYRLEPRAAENGGETFAAIYLKDDSAAHPGAGQSVLLRIEKSSGAVTEMGWQ
jgi:hypothetical protein